jgi:hypothetical protein
MSRHVVSTRRDMHLACQKYQLSVAPLPDCDDKIRQGNLMDAMIRKLFEYSSACGVSEEAWRKKVELRLPKKPL